MDFTAVAGLTLAEYAARAGTPRRRRGPRIATPCAPRARWRCRR
ncbi:MAG: hypothetical protein U0802_12980 [Candidatus Binatia bacterium]